MYIEFLLDTFRNNAEADAIVWNDRIFNYQWLRQRTLEWIERIAAEEIAEGAVVALEADFSPNAVALFLALIDRGAVLVPLTSSVAAKRDEFMTVAECEVSIQIDEQDNVAITKLPVRATHQLYAALRELRHPGLVLFSSGSTGRSKGAVHDMVPLLEKFKVARRRLRAISFLLYDHIGGVNTMLYNLSNGGCLVTVRDRSPDHVLRMVERYAVELLPTSPTFINLMILSEAYRRHDISSLRTVTYGTEPMPESTLKRFHQLFPAIILQQTYGLSELGILRSKSKSSDSLWVKVGGEGFETRIVNGILQIKAQSAMLGYLNADSPFTEDGWFNTGDEVEADGEYIRILGRRSEIINVGGEKVYPAEVESVIQEFENVGEVTVYGEKNPITGQIVCAKITPREAVEDDQRKEYIARLKRFCRERLQSYKVPVKVAIVENNQYSSRFKKIRANA